MKKCNVCGKWKDENEFYIRHRYKNGKIDLRGECKECHSKSEMERYFAKQEFMDSMKKPCAKCGESRIRCISFHHKEPQQKEFTIGTLRKSDFRKIKNEIDKCICLCHNCHHEFHYLNNKTGITLEEYLK